MPGSVLHTPRGIERDDNPEGEDRPWRVVSPFGLLAEAAMQRVGCTQCWVARGVPCSGAPVDAVRDAQYPRPVHAQRLTHARRLWAGEAVAVPSTMQRG